MKDSLHEFHPSRVLVGKKIDSLMIENNKDNTELAKHCDVTPRAVTRWRAGTENITLDNLELIVDFFKIEMALLLPRRVHQLNYILLKKEEKKKANEEKMIRLRR